MADNLAYVILFFKNYAVAIIFAIFFSFLSIIVTQYLSNKISQFTTYHSEEKLIDRIHKLFSLYLLLSLPSIVVIYLLLIGTTSSLLSENSMPEDYKFKFMILSIEVSFIIPLVTRVAALVKRPFPYKCKNCIDLKCKKINFIKRIKILYKLNCENDCSEKNLYRTIWISNHERIVSFAYSLIGSALVIILFLIILLLSDIFKLFDLLHTNLESFLNTTEITIIIPTENSLLYILLIVLFITSIFIVSIVGEVFLLIFGGVSEFLIDKKDGIK